MKTKIICFLRAQILTALLLLLVGSGCSTTGPERRDLATVKQQQSVSSPSEVLEWLQRGNERFASGKQQPRPRPTHHSRRAISTGCDSELH
jgi:hypothetical protein